MSCASTQGAGGQGLGTEAAWRRSPSEDGLAGSEAELQTKGPSSTRHGEKHRGSSLPFRPLPISCVHAAGWGPVPGRTPTDLSPVSPSCTARRTGWHGQGRGLWDSKGHWSLRRKRGAPTPPTGLVGAACLGLAPGPVARSVKGRDAQQVLGVAAQVLELHGGLGQEEDFHLLRLVLAVGLPVVDLQEGQGLMGAAMEAFRSAGVGAWTRERHLAPRGGIREWLSRRKARPDLRLPGGSRVTSWHSLLAVGSLESGLP